MAEGRVTKGWRFYFKIQGDEYVVLSVVPILNRSKCIASRLLLSCSLLNGSVHARTNLLRHPYLNQRQSGVAQALSRHSLGMPIAFPFVRFASGERHVQFAP